MMEDQEQEEQNPQRDASDSAVRFPAWIALAVLSIVTFFSAVGRRNSNTSAERWTLAVTTLSWIFGIVGVLFYMYGRGIFMSQISEVILVGTTLLLNYFVLVCLIAWLDAHSGLCLLTTLPTTILQYITII